MNVAEVKITKVKPNNGLIAFASVVVDSKLRLNSIAIHEIKNQPGQYRLTYPSKHSGDYTFQIFHPISAELAKKIELSIFNELKKVMHENDRHHNPDPKF